MPSGENPLTVKSAASGEPLLSPESIGSAYGHDLAAESVVASNPANTFSLSGVNLRLRDSTGSEQLAQLFLVSPEQVNFMVPAATSTGPATVLLTNSAGKLYVGTVEIRRTAPALFSANARGSGIAFALAVRTDSSGNQTFMPVSECEGDICSAVPIDLGNETDQTVLVLFGTGIRYANGVEDITVAIGGVPAPVIKVGAQGEFLGVDEVNVKLSRELVGKGEVEVRLTLAGQPANLVTVRIR
jgi:uncharacterized protein (TIGR03437 family)